MRNLFCLVIAASLTLGLVSAEPARADRGYFHASECLSVQPAAWSADTAIWRGSWGIQYFESTSRSVFCPIRIDAVGNVNPTGGRIRVYEASDVDDIACTPYFIDDAVTFTLPTRYTCLADQANGCTIPNFVSGQDGYLTWTDIDFPNGNRSGEMTAAFECSFGNANGSFMQISSYEITY